MRKASLVFVILVAGLLVAGSSGWVDAQPQNFRAQLAGANEVPAVDTKARGNATFQLSADGTQISYRVVVANIDDVRASHIHMAPEGVNGPVVVTLFGGPTINGRVSGVLAEGTFGAGDLQGPLAGMELGDLLDRLQAGNLYVNVHTDAHPPGEIRGQIQ